MTSFDDKVDAEFSKDFPCDVFETEPIIPTNSLFANLDEVSCENIFESENVS